MLGIEKKTILFGVVQLKQVKFNKNLLTLSKILSRYICEEKVVVFYFLHPSNSIKSVALHFVLWYPSILFETILKNVRNSTPLTVCFVCKQELVLFRQNWQTWHSYEESLQNGRCRKNLAAVRIQDSFTVASPLFSRMNFASNKKSWHSWFSIVGRLNFFFYHNIYQMAVNLRRPWRAWS